MPRILHHLIPRTVTLQPKPDPKPDQSLEIYTPKQGEDHPHLFDTGVPPPQRDSRNPLISISFLVIKYKDAKNNPYSVKITSNWPTHVTNVRETYSLEAFINQ